MTKILHIVSDMGQGGAQTYVLDLISSLNKLGGVDIELMALFSRGALWHKVDSFGIKSYCLEMRGAKDLVHFLRLFKFLRVKRYDVIHVHTIFPLLGLLLFFSSPKSLRIYTEHAGGLLKGEIFPRLVYWLFPWCYHHIVAVSGYMLRIMKDVNPFLVSNKFVVIPNGSNVEVIKRKPVFSRASLPEVFHIRSYCLGIVGRLEEQKGMFNFLDAANAILKSRSDVSFIIVGEGTQRKALEDYAKKLEISSHVLFMGFREDAVEIIKSFDLFLFTSNQESFGLVITEAMMAGTAVVAMDIESAVTEIIDNNIDGYVIKNNNIEEFSEKVNILLDNTELRQKFIRNARLKVEHKFSIQANANAIKKMYLQ